MTPDTDKRVLALTGLVAGWAALYVSVDRKTGLHHTWTDPVAALCAVEGEDGVEYRAIGVRDLTVFDVVNDDGYERPNRYTNVELVAYLGPGESPALFDDAVDAAVKSIKERWEKTA